MSENLSWDWAKKKNHNEEDNEKNNFLEHVFVSCGKYGKLLSF